MIGLAYDSHVLSERLLSVLKVLFKAFYVLLLHYLVIGFAAVELAAEILDFTVRLVLDTSYLLFLTVTPDLV